jgi:DNA-binding response OmpR family regulator
VGYAVEECAGGGDVVARVQAGGVALLILDLWMPGVDGVQVLAQLTALGCAVPVLVVTGVVSAEPPGLGHRLIAKPVDLEALYAAVAELIGEPGRAP